MAFFKKTKKKYKIFFFLWNLVLLKHINLLQIKNMGNCQSYQQNQPQEEQEQEQAIKHTSKPIQQHITY